jgi:hypothetical protein
MVEQQSLCKILDCTNANFTKVMSQISTAKEGNPAVWNQFVDFDFEDVVLMSFSLFLTTLNINFSNIISKKKLFLL